MEDYVESEDDDVFEPPKPKKRRMGGRMWTKCEEFDSPAAAEKAANTAIWKKSSSKYVSEGHKVEYRCSHGKYREAECLAGLYLLYHCDSTWVSLFLSLIHI